MNGPASFIPYDNWAFAIAWLTEKYERIEAANEFAKAQAGR
jgi:hypothetical protein